MHSLYDSLTLSYNHVLLRALPSSSSCCACRAKLRGLLSRITPNNPDLQVITLILLTLEENEHEYM